MKFKKLLLCLFVVACFSAEMLAQDFPETSWRDLADTSWYNENDTEFDISSAEELAGLSLLVEEGDSFESKIIHIVADINLDENIWEPIGYGNDNPFSGTVYGNNHVISNLLITGLNRDFLGLFGQTVGASFYDIIVDGAHIDDVGGDSAVLVANMYTNGLIQNCHVRNADITMAGGSIGGLNGGALTDSYIKKSSFSGNVTGENQVGGLSSQVWDQGGVSESWSEGTVTGEYIVGGLIGFGTMTFMPDRNVVIENSYSRSDVTALSEIGMAGGLYGAAQSNVIIKNSYSTGLITGQDAVGAVIGSAGAVQVENVYFDSETAGTDVAVGDIQGPADLDIEAKTTEEMTTADFAATLNAEQEDAPWNQEEGVNDNYPFLGEGNLSIDKNESLQIALYPTAVENDFTIQSDANLQGYQIYSLQGRLVRQGNLGTGKNNIHVAQLSSGIYLVKVYGNQQSVTKKIIKK